MPRPKLEEQKVRKKWISVRVNETEHNKITKSARVLSLSSSDYLRRLGLKNKIIPILPAVDRDTYRQISGIAKNINQIVAKINSGVISEVKASHYETIKNYVEQVGAKLLR